MIRKEDRTFFSVPNMPLPEKADGVHPAMMMKIVGEEALKDIAGLENDDEKTALDIEAFHFLCACARQRNGDRLGLKPGEKNYLP